MLTSGEFAELRNAHLILINAYDYLLEVRKSDIDALLMILDARVLVQEEIVSGLFSQGDGFRC